MELCRALGKVDTRDAMLSLCGLPNPVAEAALAILPRGHAKKVRASMSGLGSVQLREIDEAKERVARASLVALELLAESVPIAA
jgi:flagellar motor switch protein FliG